MEVVQTAATAAAAQAAAAASAGDSLMGDLAKVSWLAARFDFYRRLITGGLKSLLAVRMLAMSCRHLQNKSPMHAWPQSF